MLQVSEQHVSDIYVRLGAEFNTTVVAFQHFGIDMRFVYVLCCAPLVADAAWSL